MQTKVLEVINDIRASKNMEAVVTLNEGDKLRDDLGLTSFDLAELTVRIDAMELLTAADGIGMGVSC